MSDTQAVLLARPPYDSATAALLERTYLREDGERHAVGPQSARQP